MEIKSVTMIGMGAVGAVVGKSLLRVLGTERFSCIASGERKVRYEKDGVLVNNERQNFRYILPEEALPSDLVIIATKNIQLQEVLYQIKNAVGKNTVILSLLNGIQSERDIASVYGSEKVLYGFIVRLSSVRNKNNITCSDNGVIVFGEGTSNVNNVINNKNSVDNINPLNAKKACDSVTNNHSERVEAIARLFDACSIEYKIPTDIKLELWKKFLMNVTCNTVSALCRAPYGTFNYDVMKDMIRDFGKEVICVANAEGINLTEQMIEDNIAIMNVIDPKGKTSMFQDIEAGRRTENKWFTGTIIELAAKHDINVPICTLMSRLIEIAEVANSISNK